jgi:hypothetical protein
MIQAYFRLVAPEGKLQEFRDVLLHVKGPIEALPECRACWICRFLVGVLSSNAP